jgi:hypothetical protein
MRLFIGKNELFYVLEEMREIGARDIFRSDLLKNTTPYFE